jgi:hypothetical protein
MAPIADRVASWSTRHRLMDDNVSAPGIMPEADCFGYTCPDVQSPCVGSRNS